MTVLSLVLTVVAAADTAPSPEWFRGAKFGIKVDADHHSDAWMNRIAAAGAKYVVSDAPDDGLAEAAVKHGLMLLNRSNYPNVGQLIPASAPRSGKAWEARFPLPDTATELIRLLVEVASKGGNLLVTLPAKPDGGRALEELGQWLRVNGESIYETSSSPFDRMPFFGRATVKGNVLYIHLFDWPADRKLRLTGLQTPVLSASLLDGGKLHASAGVVDLPKLAPHVAGSVIKLTLSGPPKVEPFIIQPDANGTLTARAESAEFESKPGLIARKDSRAGHAVITRWTRAIDVPSWKVRVPRDGRYAVEMLYSAGQESAGVVYTITMRGFSMGMAKGIVQATPGRRMPVSDMVLEAGDYMLVVQPENKPGQPAMELEAVILSRIGD